MRLFLLFALFVTVPINSYIYIPSYGLFGELKTLAVADEYYSNYPTKIEKTVQGAGRMAENHLPALFADTGGSAYRPRKQIYVPCI